MQIVGDTHQPQRDIDPDFFDMILQGISAIAGVATMVQTWIYLKDRASPQRGHSSNTLEQMFRSLERSFDDVFYNLRKVLGVIRNAYDPKSAVDIDSLSPRFGSAAVRLSTDEFNQILQPLQQIEDNVRSVRQAAVIIEQQLQFSRPSAEEQIDFSDITLNSDLNEILFNSKTFGEATEKLQIAEVKVQRFLRSVNRLMVGNKL